MFQESILDRVLYQLKRVIPRQLFDALAPAYHTLLSYVSAFWYGFPSRRLTVIGVTGTKGKSTTVYMISRIFEQAGYQVAAIGSLGLKIKDQEWPNTLKMTMPGRMKLQKFLARAVAAGCTHAIIEVTSEGIKQKRHLGITFDTAVFTNIHREHLESHGSFENYLAAKQELFKVTAGSHILNADDPAVQQFAGFPAQRKIFYGLANGDIRGRIIESNAEWSECEVEGLSLTVRPGGRFNVLNALAALAVAQVHGVPLTTIRDALSELRHLPGRLEFVQQEPFAVVVDYAHTPDSLEAVYKTLRADIDHRGHGRLIAVLGAAGGGRDKWKRPEFGALAQRYAQLVILTNEDPYEEDPDEIVRQIVAGCDPQLPQPEVIMDRREALEYALNQAQPSDVVVVTGKGSETSIALSGGRKEPWSDRAVLEGLLLSRSAS